MGEIFSFQMFETELNRLRKIKKSMSAKHRLLSKNHIRTTEELNLGLMGGLDTINVEINETFRIVDDTKKSIQITLKQLDKIKLKLEDVKLRLNNFEIKYEGVLHTVGKFLITKQQKYFRFIK